MAIYFTEVDVKTDKSIEEVIDATKRALRRVGGGINSSGNNIRVMNGANGVSMAFMSTLSAIIEVQEHKDNKFTINATITKTPNAMFWVALVAGFCLFLISWILNILYFVSDPTPQYQMALDQVQNELDK